MDFGVFSLGVQQSGQSGTFDYFRVTGTGTENRAPVADDDSATTPRDTPVDVPVLAGDTDPDGDTLSVESATDPAHGSTSVNADGTVRYTPDAGYTGTDTFDYTVTDGEATDTATVTVTVTAPCGPTSYDDTFDGASLDKCRWDAIQGEDTSKYTVVDGELRLTTTPGEIYPGGTAKSNYILQSASHAGDDFVLETGLDASALTGGYSQAGIMVYGNDANYVKLDFLTGENAGSAIKVEMRSEVGDVIVGNLPQAVLAGRPGGRSPAAADQIGGDVIR